jgi:hypothetical protein
MAAPTSRWPCTGSFAEGPRSERGHAATSLSVLADSATHSAGQAAGRTLGIEFAELLIRILHGS